MDIKQFYDKGLAHASYVVSSGNKAVVVDPGRDPQPYYDHVKEVGAKIVGVIETHPHADFVSSHLEIARDTGATVYVSKRVGADYPHQGFDEGDVVRLNGIRMRAIHTPGHSPDSISVVVEDERGKQRAVFTGDTLFIGDVGRPDLREDAGEMRAEREELARQMYHSTREKLMQLDEEAIVYPAHGAGSLCGKNMSDDLSSTLGRQLRENPALQPMSEAEFVDWLLEGQPFIPKYFPYNVDLNKRGAPDLEQSLAKVPRLPAADIDFQTGILVIDTRPEDVFKKGHLPGAINIMNGNKFETWLGSIVAPGESFYLIAEHQEALEEVIRKAAKIGYETFIRGAVVAAESINQQNSDQFDLGDFKKNPEQYTILDIRNKSEVAEGKFFKNALSIPLPELRERADEIPTDKPVVVHCAGGYRSAAGSSLVAKAIGDQVEVYDLSEAVKQFTNRAAAHAE